MKNVYTFCLISICIFRYSDIPTGHNGRPIKNTCLCCIPKPIYCRKKKPLSFIDRSIYTCVKGLCECDMKTNSNMHNKLSFVKTGGERD